MPDVTLEIDDNIAIITIENPEVKNALTPEMGDKMREILEEINANADVGAAVIRGAGGTFCSGADTRNWDPNRDLVADEHYKNSGRVYGTFMKFGELRVPTIAAVRGAAVGAGMNLLLAADLRVVAKNARLISGFLKIPIHPGGGYFTISGRLAGREATTAMGIFSEEVSGEQAVDIGLAWQALEDEEVEDRAIELARRPAKDPELAREVIRSLRTELGPPAIPWSAALEFERATQMWSQRRRNP